jgi:hypothetical protein
MERTSRKEFFRRANYSEERITAAKKTYALFFFRRGVETANQSHG